MELMARHAVHHVANIGVRDVGRACRAAAAPGQERGENHLGENPSQPKKGFFHHDGWQG
jgi:hypothetical protein